MISLTNISKTFNPGTVNEQRILHDFDFEIKEKEFIVIVGSNGSGKSTILNLIAGNIFPDSGKILINDIDITNFKDYERSKWIARMFQNPLSGTAPDLTVLENFRLASVRTSSKKLSIGINERFRQLVRDKISLLNIGLENKINQPMGTLSGGQRQALTLLMAVADHTKLLLMDEPAAALDPASADTLMKAADKIIRAQNLTALLVTHQMKDAIEFGDRLIQMDKGRIVKDLNDNAKKALHVEDLYKWFSR